MRLMEFFLFLEQVFSGIRLAQRIFVRLTLRIVVFKSGEMRLYLSYFGKTA